MHELLGGILSRDWTKGSPCSLLVPLSEPVLLWVCGKRPWGRHWGKNQAAVTDPTAPRVKRDGGPACQPPLSLDPQPPESRGGAAASGPDCAFVPWRASKVTLPVAPALALPLKVAPSYSHRVVLWVRSPIVPSNLSEVQRVTRFSRKQNAHWLTVKFFRCDVENLMQTNKNVIKIMWFPSFSYYHNCNANVWEKWERMHTGFNECVDGICLNFL